jgi:hypothetical protein
MNGFDLIEYQQKAREANSPKNLFLLWEKVCWYYDRGQIGQYELDEMKSVIWPTLRTLDTLRSMIDGTTTTTKVSRNRSKRGVAHA